MAGKQKRDFGREARDTVVKSSLTGVGVTVLAVTALSPAGFGGMIGTSVASAVGGEHTSAASDPYAKLPPFPTLLTQTEISDIHGQLAATAAAMEITRAATDDRIEFIHELAARPDALLLAPVRHVAKTQAATSERQVVAAAPQAAPVAHTVVAAAPVTTVAPQAEPAATPIAPISFVQSPSDSHLELASLLLGDN